MRESVWDEESAYVAKSSSNENLGRYVILIKQMPNLNSQGITSTKDSLEDT